MAKASSSLSAEMHNNPAIAAAAAEIHNLINSRPHTPRREEIAAIIERAVPRALCPISDLDARIRKLLPLMRAADLKAAEADSANETPEWKAAEAKSEQMDQRLCALECEAFSTSVMTMADVQARATIAAYWGDADDSGQIEWLNSTDRYRRALARLLEAVLQVRERGGVAGVARGASSSQPTAELARWDAFVREYLAHIEREMKKPGWSSGPCDHDARFWAEAERFWARPCTTWAEVVLRAAVAVYCNTPAYADGPGYPDDVITPRHQSDQSMDDRSLAFLVRGILDMAGLAFDIDGRLLTARRIGQ